MSLIRYTANHPRALQDEIKQVFDKFFNEDADASSVVTSQWMPRVDIKEEADRFVIQADIPGVDPSQIEIHMEKGVLTIKGERKQENTAETDKYTRVERTHGLFYRRFSLPDSANPEQISATGKHGVLEIVIPKRAETTPRKIEIKAN